MDWIRQNKTLATIFGVMAVGGLGLAALLVTSYLGFASSVEQYETANGAVAALKGAKLFPSEQNVKAKQVAVSEYEQAVSTLGTVLLRLQQPVVPLSETEFQAKLKGGIAKIRQAAEKRTALPKEFAFGFDAYTSSLPKNAEAATELGDYLAAVESVTDLAIASGVTSIDSIQRTELQIEKGVPASTSPPPASSKKGGKPSGKKGAVSVKPPKEIAKVVERRTVTLTFTADQGPLQKMMNDLASPSKMPFFTIVRQLRVENEKQEGPLRGSLNITSPTEASVDPEAPKQPETAPDPAAPPKIEVIETAKPAAPDAQAVFGEEKLKVFMEIDIVRFLEPTSSNSVSGQ